MLCRAANEGLRVVIMDFGLAGAVALDANEGGTPGYLAPELIKGEKASFASDIYSLGVILYEIVTGRFPIQAKILAFRQAKPFCGSVKPQPGAGLEMGPDRSVLSRCISGAPYFRCARGDCHSQEKAHSQGSVCCGCPGSSSRFW